MTYPPSSRDAFPPTRFVAQYYYRTKNGGRTRTQLGASTNQLSSSIARTESAVLAYLRKRHPGLEIELVSVEWF